MVELHGRWSSCEEHAEVPVEENNMYIPHKKGCNELTISWRGCLHSFTEWVWGCHDLLTISQSSSFMLQWQRAYCQFPPTTAITWTTDWWKGFWCPKVGCAELNLYSATANLSGCLNWRDVLVYWHHGKREYHSGASCSGNPISWQWQSKHSTTNITSNTKYQIRETTYYKIHSSNTNREDGLIMWQQTGGHFRKLGT